MSVNHADIESFYQYMGSFEAFARDFFDVETDHDLTTNVVDYVGHEDIIVAHVIWSVLFKHNRTYVVACPTMIVARHWRQLVADALAKLPNYMVPEFRGRSDVIDLANANKILFRICNENSFRGMAISNLYVIEPPLIKNYYTFMQAVLPTMTAGKNRQTFNYSRGY